MKIRIFLILYLLLILLNVCKPQSNPWVSIQSPTYNNLFKSSFVDSLNGWVVGANGTIIHTTDGGNTWIFQNSASDYQIISVSFVNRNKGWAVANKFLYYSPVIYSTTNGGDNWNIQLYQDTTQIFNTIYFRDSLNGFIGGYRGLILKTSNGGLNWTRSLMDSSFISFSNVINFKALDNNNILACGGAFDIAGVLWKSSDGGSNWRGYTITAEPINDLLVFDSLNFSGVGGDFEYGASFVKTTDGGYNWQYQPFTYFGIGYSISARTRNEWWVAFGPSRYFAYTTNPGNNWQYIQLPDSTEIYDVNFADSLHGWAFGYYGKILKYNSSTNSIRRNETNEIPGKIILYQNYPNPFNPSTNIKFDLPENGKWKMENGIISLKVYDILGKEITTLINENLKSGTYKLTFDGSDLPSGIYFYKITTGDFSETKRMLLIK